jgi:hypothetical protein
VAPGRFRACNVALSRGDPVGAADTPHVPRFLMADVWSMALRGRATTTKE